MDIDAIARNIVLASRHQEPAARPPLPPVQLSPDTWQRARPLLATRRRPLPVGDPFWRKRPAARRRAELDDPPSGHSPWEYPTDTQQDTQQESNKKADATPHSATATEPAAGISTAA